jgi:hypothetical protein
MVGTFAALVSQKELFFALLFAPENTTGLEMSPQTLVSRQRDVLFSPAVPFF